MDGSGDGHLWFFGTDQDYWNSPVNDQRPEEFEDLPSGGPMGWDEEVFDAGETTMAEMATQLDLEDSDGSATSSTTATSGASTPS